jgi:hypothetical protein
LQLTSNAYNNGTNWIYENNGYANSYQNYQGQHLWYNAPSGTAGNAITFTQAMTLDASGKLLVGLTSATSFVSNLIVNRQNVINSPIFTWTNGINNSGHTYIFNNGTGNGAGVSADGYLAFGSNEGGAGTFTERVRINTSGNLLVGTTSAPVAGANSAWANPGSTVFSMGPNGGNAFVLYNPSSVGCYVVGGQTGWTGTSDGTLKNVIAPITNGLSSIIGLKPTIYSWKSDKANIPYAGLIAQEVQSVFPDLVNDNNGTLGVNYTGVIPYLISAIQELSAQVTTLQTQVTALQTKVSA